MGSSPIWPAMPAARLDQIKYWFDQAVSMNATHLIVVCDTFDYDDYPVYVPEEININEAIKKYDGVDMQKIMEIYKISLGWDSQKSYKRKIWNI